MRNDATAVNPKRYGQLLALKLPAVIRSEEENERLIAELEELDQRHDELSPEEREYSELLTVLIESFEDAHYALEGSTPHTWLRSLMEEHGIRQRDLLDAGGRVFLKPTPALPRPRPAADRVRAPPRHTKSAA